MHGCSSAKLYNFSGNNVPTSEPAEVSPATRSHAKVSSIPSVTIFTLHWYTTIPVLSFVVKDSYLRALTSLARSTPPNPHIDHGDPCITQSQSIWPDMNTSLPTNITCCLRRKKLSTTRLPFSVMASVSLALLFENKSKCSHYAWRGTLNYGLSALYQKVLSISPDGPSLDVFLSVKLVNVYTSGFGPIHSRYRHWCVVQRNFTRAHSQWVCTCHWWLRIYW